MGVRGTPSISSPGRTPSPQDSTCSSSAGGGGEKEDEKSKNLHPLHLSLLTDYDPFLCDLRCISDSPPLPPGCCGDR